MRRGLPVLLALAVVAGACSAAGDGVPSTDAGVLRMGLETPQTLDPARAQYLADLLVVEQLFDGLTAYHPVTLAVRPALASRWESSADQRFWTFHLRPDARFSNGRPIQPEDVKYTLERIAARGSGSPAAPELSSILGYQAFSDGKADGLAGVNVEPGIVKFELQHSLSSFPALLSNPAFGIVPREAVEAADPAFADQPVGSGPFMIRSRSATVLRLMPAPGVKMALRGIEIHLGRDGDAPYAAFLRGGLDWTAIPAERVDQVVKDRGRDGFHPYVGELFYGFNLKNPKFADGRFREAIVRAIDRQGIVRVVYGDRMRLASGVVAAGVPGHQPDPCGDVCRHDPARAKALLADAFGSNPVPEVNIDYDDDPTQEAVAAVIEGNLKAVGIPALRRPLPYAEYLKFASSGQQEFFRMSWIAAFPGADAFLAPLFYTGQPNNITGFANGDFDGWIRAAREQGDETKRITAYQEAEKLLMQNLAVMPIAQYETHSLVSPRVRDLIMSAMGTFDASRVSLDG